MQFFKICIVLLALTGCANESQVLKDTFLLALKNQSQVDVTLGKKLIPNYPYLRLVLDGRVSLLVLGYRDKNFDTDQTSDIWYGGTSEVFKLKEGRIAAISGTAFDWVSVRAPLAPKWEDMLNDAFSKPYQFVRERDEAVNYRYGIQEKVTLQRIVAPSNTVLAGIPWQSLVWFKESYEPKHLPDSVFAVEPASNTNPTARVIYSRQCVRVDVCLEMQIWRPEDQDEAMQKAKPLAKPAAKP